MTTESTKEGLLAKLAEYGQQHLLAFWDALNGPRRRSLAAEIAGIDFALVNELSRQGDGKEEVKALAARAVPPPAFRLDASESAFAPGEARRRGAEVLSAGQVGVMVVAGGQGTRLGFDHPKGMYPIGPVSEHSLFQIHVEKILAASRRYGARIPLYVMTSPATDAETKEFLAAHDRFGLPDEDLWVFCQGTMPAVDAATGKVLLEAPDHVALSPNGHGGMLRAFADSGALDEARSRGIRHLFYFQVDNPLVDTCGPDFLGYHVLAGSEFSSQVVAKQDPLEKVGNVVQVDGRLHVIEYSDLPEDVAEKRNEDGSLVIWAGSIAVHAIDVDLLGRMAAHAGALPFHVAPKRVPYVDGQGQRVEPGKKELNAKKFERFIFDLLPDAAGAIVVEVDAAGNFAPLKKAFDEKKDAPQRDTPEWVRAQMVALYAEWLRHAGAEVDQSVAVEISPLFALDAEEMAEKVKPGLKVESPTYFQ